MPTFVLIDKAGIVRLYYPGKMTYEELAPRSQSYLSYAAKAEVRSGRCARHAGSSAA